jgi:hypothetical protein
MENLVEIGEFRACLKKNGQSLKWFYDNRIKKISDLTYGGFCHQLNGYSPLSDNVERELKNYIEENKK